MDTYEKKYKEAQKWIESIYPNLSHEQQMEAETFFPELAESEDEKIRKDIIDFVRHSVNRIPAQKFNKYIVWLEKQGEEKAQAKSLWHEYNHPIDKDRLFLLISKNKRSSIMLWNGETLKSVTFGGGGGIILEGDNFAYIDELQEIQNPAEWSEEDENRINRLIAYFEDKESFTAEDDIVYANWLKSLRPQNNWKPSDEQMKQLGWIAEQNKDNMIGKELISLYQDLKKLREE